MEQVKSVTELFLDKYKQLESEIQHQYKGKGKDKDTEIVFIENKPEFRIYRDGLKWCREIRNLLTHNPKVKNAFPIEPSQEMIDLLDELILKVRSRKTCRQVGTPFSKMYCRTIVDSVVETIEEMRRNAFTYIPIMDGKKVIGIFDENSLFCYVADNGIVDLENLTFEDIKEYIGLDGREMEVFTFHDKGTYIDELQEEFHRQFEDNKRVGVAFITENGKRGEAVTHMLTAWDVIGK